jgi:hypothetical protein
VKSAKQLRQEARAKKVLAARNVSKTQTKVDEVNEAPAIAVIVEESDESENQQTVAPVDVDPESYTFTKRNTQTTKKGGNGRFTRNTKTHRSK